MLLNRHGLPHKGLREMKRRVKQAAHLWAVAEGERLHATRMEFNARMAVNEGYQRSRKDHYTAALRKVLERSNRSIDSIQEMFK